MKNAAAILVTFGILTTFLGLMFLLYAWSAQAAYQDFLANGKEAQGKIIEKRQGGSRRSRTYEVRVTFTNKSLLEGGKVQFGKAEVTGSLWEKLNIDEKVTVLFLPNSSEETVVLKVSTLPENMAPVETYGFAFYTIGIGLVMFLVGFVLVKINKKE